MRSRLVSGIASGVAVALVSAAVGVGAATLTAQGGATMVPMTVRSVGTIGGSYVVLLEDGQHKVQLPIGIGPLEAIAIDRRVRGEKPPRPFTHELLESTVAALGGRVDRVEVIEMRDDIFIGRVTLRDAKGQTHSVDSRSSDAIALGVGAGLPIFVAQSVLSQAGYPAQAIP